MRTAVSFEIKYIIYNKSQDYSVLFINAVRPVICEGWYFTYTRRSLA